MIATLFRPRPTTLPQVTSATRVEFQAPCSCGRQATWTSVRNGDGTYDGPPTITIDCSCATEEAA